MVSDEVDVVVSYTTSLDVTLPYGVDGADCSLVHVIDVQGGPSASEDKIEPWVTGWGKPEYGGPDLGCDSEPRGQAGEESEPEQQRVRGSEAQLGFGTGGRSDLNRRGPWPRRVIRDALLLETVKRLIGVSHFGSIG